MAYLYVALFCLVLLFLWKMKGRSLKFPGPSGYPIIGCCLSMRDKPMHEVLYDWSMQYGGAYKFSLFGKELLVIGHPDTLREALVTKGNIFAARAEEYTTQEFTQRSSMAFNNNTACNITLRKAVHGSIKAYGAGRTRLAAVLDTAIADMLERVSETRGQPFDPMGTIYRATSLSVCLLLSGQRLDEIEDLPQAVKKLNAAAIAAVSYTVGSALLNAAPFLRHVAWAPHVSILRHSERMRDEINEHVIQPALEKSKLSDEHTIGKALLDMVGQKYGEGEEAGVINMLNVKQTCMDLIIGGTGTTSNTFYSLLNILQWNPDIQEKIYQEVIKEVGDGRAVVLEDKDKLPYTSAAVLEILRYVTSAPLGLPHMAREDTTIAGIAVPQGTEVLTNLWACHHDPRLYPDPWTYNPERFLDDDGQLLSPEHNNRKMLFAFGAGARVCVGEVLAISRLFLFATNCVQRFRFSPPEGADPSSCDVRKFKFAAALQPPGYQTIASARGQA